MNFLLPIIAALAITNVTDLVTALQIRADGAKFALEGKIAMPPSGKYPDFVFLGDHDLAIIIQAPAADGRTWRSGDLVKVSGRILLSTTLGTATPVASEIEFRSHSKPPEPTPIKPGDLKSTRYDKRFVKISGIIRECFHDEIDPNWVFTSIESNGDTVFAVMPNISIYDDLKDLTDAIVTVKGVFDPRFGGNRNLTQRMILGVTGIDAFEILTPPPLSPFDLPSIDGLLDATATDIFGLGRRRLSGKVVARWDRNLVLLRDKYNYVHKVRISDNALPDIGAAVEVAGQTETDLFSINFANATWRRIPDTFGPARNPETVSLDGLFEDGQGRAMINTFLYGRRLRVTGKVQDILYANGKATSLVLKGEKHALAVDLGNLSGPPDGIETGSEIEVTGTYVIETANWFPYAAFPHVAGAILAIDGPDDVRVISGPPVWTPARLSYVIGSLILLLTAIFIWNRALRKLVDRRSRELLKEKVAHIDSELRLEERTRLAVELHDSVLQNLTSVALQIGIAKRLSQTNAPSAEAHFDIAAKALSSCHEELRNCIWDLRNQTLEEHDMNEAIRRVLEPCLGDAELSVRFSISRRILTDNTAYAILRILRELASNAVKHGHAQSVKVAGALENQKILLSVRDDGCGFDPSNRPGIAEGHFGLQGVSERIKRYHGTIDIDSRPQQGTHVRITLEIKNQQSNAKDLT